MTIELKAATRLRASNYRITHIVDEEEALLEAMDELKVEYHHQGKLKLGAKSYPGVQTHLPIDRFIPIFLSKLYEAKDEDKLLTNGSPYRALSTYALEKFSDGTMQDRMYFVLSEAGKDTQINIMRWPEFRSFCR